MPSAARLSLSLFALILLLTAGCDSTSSEEDDNPILQAEANTGAWTWIAVDGAQCRDGSPTGIGVRLQEGADRLAIYLEGGGACFNVLTCAQNPSRFGESEFADVAARRGTSGLFDPANPANPIRGWHMIYVPYCTGDVHAGDAPGAAVEGFGAQQFVGHRNMERYLALVAPYFRDSQQVLLTGASAGGFGAFFNTGLVADAFADAGSPADLVLLNDSGPILADDDALAPSLQQTWRQLWNLNETLPEGFPSRTSATGDGLEDAYAYFADTYPGITFGLLSYDRDAVIRSFYGFAGWDGASLPQSLDADVFEAALYAQRDLLPPSWGTFYVPGDAHTFIASSSRFYDPLVEGRSVADWLGDLLAGTPSDVGSPTGSSILVETEPNNSPSTAQAISGQSPITLFGEAAIGDVGELGIDMDLDGDGTTDVFEDWEDWYSFTTSSSGLRITLTGLESDLDLYVVDPNGSEIIDRSVQSGTNPEEVYLPRLAPGSYFVAVSIFDPEPQGPAESAYDLRLELNANGTVTPLVMHEETSKENEAAAKALLLQERARRR